MIYGEREPRLDPLPAPAVPRSEVVEELYAAVAEGAPPLHGGEWGAATMDVCFAILKSSREKREVVL
jgi:phthalate 4,5-cis-dihydrodiol dehydrogenase